MVGGRIDDGDQQPLTGEPRAVADEEVPREAELARA
jgi:hypothetical protein